MSTSEPPASPHDDNVDRRSFLKWIIASLGSLMAFVLGGAGGGYFLSPLFQRRKEEWIDLGLIKAFLPGVPTKVEYVERQRDAWVVTERRVSAWVLRTDQENFAVFDPHCTHLGCPYRWSAEKNQFLCPCHNGVFSLDGTVVSGPPPRPLDRYPVK